MYTRKEAEFIFIGFQPTLIGEQSGLLQFIEKIGFLLSTAGYVVNILLPVRKVTTRWHPTSFQLYSSMLAHQRYVEWMQWRSVLTEDNQ